MSLCNLASVCGQARRSAALTLARLGHRCAALLCTYPACSVGLGVALISAVLLFGNLSYPLLEPDEGRYAEIPLLMLRSQDLLVPTLHGKPYNDKPPLTYWLTALAYTVLGPGEFAARSVPAAAAWLCLLAVYGWACRTLGWRAALGGCFVLCTMAGYVGFGRMLLLDGVLTLWVVLALLSGHLALAGGRVRWSWWLTSAVCAGLAVLTKGPVGLVLVVPPLAIYRLLDAGSARWQLRHVVGYLAVAAGIAAPWYLGMLILNPDFAQDFFWRHNWQRFLAPYHHQKPWWFYGPALLVELLPWSFLMPLVAWSLWRQPLRPPVRLCAVAAGWVFLFFSTASCKLPTYLMPLLPMMAVLLGNVMEAELWQAGAASRRKVLAVGVTLALLVSSLTFLAIVGHVIASGREWVEWLVAALTFLGLVATGVAVYTGRLRTLWASGLTMCVILAAFWAWDVIPEHAEAMSSGTMVKELQQYADMEGAALAAYRGQWDAASFYQGGRELTVFSSRHPAALRAFVEGHPRALVLVRQGQHDDVRQLRAQLPPGAVVERVLDSGKVRAVLIVMQP